jgi:hypothetical protein
MVEFNALKGLKLPPKTSTGVENNSLFIDTTDKLLKIKNDAGVIEILGAQSPENTETTITALQTALAVEEAGTIRCYSTPINTTTYTSTSTTSTSSVFSFNIYLNPGERLVAVMGQFELSNSNGSYSTGNNIQIQEKAIGTDGSTWTRISDNQSVTGLSWTTVKLGLTLGLQNGSSPYGAYSDGWNHTTATAKITLQGAVNLWTSNNLGTAKMKNSVFYIYIQSSPKIDSAGTRYVLN